MFSKQNQNNNSSNKTKIILGAIGLLAGSFAIGYFLTRNNNKKEEEVKKQDLPTNSSSTTTTTSSDSKKTTPTSSSTTTTSSAPTTNKIRNIPELLKKIALRRQEGNAFFTQGKLDQAIECYQQCTDLAELCGTNDEARKQGGLAMSNAMQCFLKQQRFEQVENSATFFLETVWSDYAEDALVAKVLYRRAVARVSLKHEDKAIEDLKLASSKTGGKSAEVEQLLQKLESETKKN
jgi:tetratricopeptide (TPR) repeat protein